MFKHAFWAKPAQTSAVVRDVVDTGIRGAIGVGVSYGNDLISILI